jgi:hypothetical protein
MKKDFYYRRLPHFQPEESVFFITYRLAGSIPLSVIAQMNEEFDIKKKQISMLPVGPKKENYNSSSSRIHTSAFLMVYLTRK